MTMTLSADARTYLDRFETWDPEGREMRELWGKISPAEREEICEALRERMHERNADHADQILRNLPRKWRDVLIERFKDMP